MALINRVTRLFQADMHAVLDRIEEPDMLLRQAVREMETALGNDMQHIRQLTLEQQHVQSQQQQLHSTLDELEGSLDTCLQSGQDDLARQVIRRKLETRQLDNLITKKSESLHHQLKTLHKQTAEQRTRLESMRQKLEILTQHQESDPVRFQGIDDIHIEDTDIEVVLLKEKQKRRAS